jgi:hypothetical protein
MALKIEVKRDVLFAPKRHVTSWALNPTYTSAKGSGMVMSVTETDGHGLGANRYREWTTTWRRFRSADGPGVGSPLKYDDGTPVWVPAAISAFERDPASGRVFWFANIQPGPVYGQIPRYPLTIAELDTKRLCILKDTVTVIQDLPPGAPKAGDPRKGELGRRYSNFGHYADRKTGEFVLLVAEEPRVTWDDYWSDTIRFRIKVRS